MWWLARAKRRTAKKLESRALEADSFQTSACFWLSVIVLVGIGLNAVFGRWWADPVAALFMTYFLVKEGRRGKKMDSRNYRSADPQSHLGHSSQRMPIQNNGWQLPRSGEVAKAHPAGSLVSLETS